MSPLRRWILLLALLPLPLPAQVPAPLPAAGDFVETPATPELIARLRKGGYVLYMRHGPTDNSRPDRVPSVDLEDCGTQRTLSDEGRAVMKQLGRAFRDARLPVGEILVSPMCRTRESARLAFGDRFVVDPALMYSANMTSVEKKPRLEALGKLLAAPVAAGTNRVLMAHAPNLADLIGLFVKPEGTVVVFAPKGDAGYDYIASIHPAMWAWLLR